jgi:aminopeptidase N
MERYCQWKLKNTSVQQGKKILHFDTSDIIPTYLFSFAAGDFKAFTEKIEQQDSRILYRETDSVKIKTVWILFSRCTEILLTI